MDECLLFPLLECCCFRFSGNGGGILPEAEAEAEDEEEEEEATAAEATVGGREEETPAESFRCRRGSSVLSFRSGGSSSIVGGRVPWLESARPIQEKREPPRDDEAERCRASTPAEEEEESLEVRFLKLVKD